MQQLQKHSKQIPWFDLFMAFLLFAFLVAGLVTNFLFYQTVRRFVATSQLPIFPVLGSFPRVSLTSPQLIVQEPAQPTGTDFEPTPEVAAPVTSPPLLDGPMTILIMGVDKRKGERGPWRTDTMILAYVDPNSKRAALVSIPRDLYVLIPDYGRGEHFERINAANVYGELFDYPGGGPALAKRTIYRNFGVQVDRYVMVDFDGFRKIIDMIGGIEIDVPRPITDYRYPTEDYGYMTVHFDAGPQHMDGERALQYARTRKSTSDFDRARRQQQVIMAVRDKVLSLDILPNMTPKNILNIINTLGNSVETDLTLEEILALARLATEIEESNISRAVIGVNYVIPRTINGKDVLVPRWPAIRQLLVETLGPEALGSVRPVPTLPPPTPTPDKDALLQAMLAEQARVGVFDATGQQGALQSVLDELMAVGLNIAMMEPVDPALYTSNQIVVYADKPATVAWLQAVYGLSDDNVQQAVGQRSDLDVALVFVKAPRGH